MAIDSASGRHSRRTVLGILAAAVVPMMPGLARGQSQQPIRLNVPFSPGTGRIATLVIATTDGLLLQSFVDPDHRPRALELVTATGQAFAPS